MNTSKTKIKSLGRLKKRSDFLCVQGEARKNKTKWVAKGLIVEFTHNADLGLRYGLTVSKRVSKLAVTRNRVKRRLKAIACEALPQYALQNLDIVLIGRVEGKTRAYEDLKNDLIWCLKKMGIEPDA